VVDLVLSNCASGVTLTNCDRDGVAVNVTNTLYMAENTNGTATMTIQPDWAPTNVPPELIHWEILNLDNSPAANWSCQKDAYSNGIAAVAWTNTGASVTRQFKVRAWYDCDRDNHFYPGGLEPARIAYVTVLKVESIEPDPMTYLMEIDDGDGDPKTRVFVVPISSDYPAEAVHVRAKILPNLTESQVPSGFGLIGGNGSERLSRTVERSSESESGKTVFTFFCGNVDSGLKTTVYVYDAKIGLYADGQIDPVGHSWAKIMMDYDSKQLISPIYQNYLTEIGFFPTNTAPWLGEDGILAGTSVPGDVRLDNAAFGSHFATGQKEYPIWFIPLRNALPQIHQMKTNPPDYNLFDFNCTDFAIMLGQLVGINTMDPAGISTPQAYASWLNSN